MMDKRYLDPRRPLGTPTKEDQAEMLVPYDVELPMAPQLFATHQQQVANLRGALFLNQYLTAPVSAPVPHGGGLLWW